jgi:hypothetical protein
MTDWLLLILAILVFIIGFIGCFLPVLPGPPVSFVGMIILHFSDRFGGYSTLFLLSFGLLALVVQILDYIVPAWDTKKVRWHQAWHLGQYNWSDFWNFYSSKHCGYRSFWTFWHNTWSIRWSPNR